MFELLGLALLAGAAKVHNDTRNERDSNPDTFKQKQADGKTRSRPR